MTTTNARTASPWAVLAICCCSLLLVGIDVTIVNIALPTIRHDLHCSLSGLQWVIDAYSLVLAAMLMFSGSLGDRLGRRRVFLAGLAAFTVASLACGLAPSLGWLVAFRLVQATGGSMLNPVAMSIIVNAFREPGDRARAIGVWGAVVGLSMALGPLVGGALVDSVGWRWIFWVNVPVGTATLALTWRWIPESRAPRPRRFDPLGQLLVAVALGSLTYAIIAAPRSGWTAPSTLTLLVVAAAAVAGLLAVEPRRPEPLLELRFFRSVPFASATVCAVAAFAAMGTFLFANTLYLQQELGLSALAAGVRTLPMAVLAGVCGPLAGRVVAATGARRPLVVSGLATAAGAALLVPIDAGTSTPHLLLAYSLIGIGFGLVNAPITNTATSGMPRAQAGVAAAIASTSRQVGMSLGVAASGSLIAGTTGGLPSALPAVWWLVIGCGVGISALGVLGTTPRAQASAASIRVAPEPEEHREFIRAGDPA
jgi:EmrB/QacA subfamily drug resistance transporter